MTESRSTETWKRHIVAQLKHRDRDQHARFQDLVRSYSRLLEKTSLAKGILSCSVRRPSSDSCSVSSLLHQENQLKTTTGDLAFQVLELQQQIRIKECVLEEQHSRLLAAGRRLAGALDAGRALQQRVEFVQQQNAALKEKYDERLELQRREGEELRGAELRGEELLEDLIQHKQQAAAHLNHRNQRRSRAREANLQKELQTAARSKVTVDSCSSAPTSRSSSPKAEDQQESGGSSRMFRSLSASSPRVLSSIRDLFERRRGHSVCSLEEDLLYPVRVCLSARVPVRALQVLEAHEQGINAVRFSSSAPLLATGGTDRVVKLWDVQAGSMTHRATLEGSTGGITCIEFDPAGFRILAASYDKSALLWRLDDSVPKVTLTGHSRKVTAARFSGRHQVVTGSADRNIRLWDLQRAACVTSEEAGSYCSDLVCCDDAVISGHFDCKIRVWDTRMAGCVQQLPVGGRVTSLDLGSDQRQLLSCCRGDCLQLLDLRRRSHDRLCFRAEGFKCGSDSTKAVISPDGCFLAAGSADGAVYIWNVSTGNLETRLPDRHRPVHLITGHLSDFFLSKPHGAATEGAPISAVSWSQSGEHVVSVDQSRRAVLWSDL